jgi:hypothetical protein
MKQSQGKLQNKNLWTLTQNPQLRKSEDNLSPVDGIETVKNKYASVRSIENHGGKGHWKAFTNCSGWSCKFLVIVALNVNVVCLSDHSRQQQLIS